MIRAASILGSGHGSERPDRAVEALAAAAPYELGDTAFITLYPVYLGGEAYLASQQGAAAAAEFQKILDHPGIVANNLIGALAHLGLGRAYASGPRISVAELAKACTAYQDFFTLWKDADVNVPILMQAKAEYAKLRAVRTN
jgi:eukaryotic-like serine/threonine-protein kinase